MKVKTTVKQFGQTMQYECEIEQLTYKQLQDYIREARKQGFTGIKLNASKEALQAEVEAIEASKAKAEDELTETHEQKYGYLALDDSPEVQADLTNSDIMVYNERNAYTPNRHEELVDCKRPVSIAIEHSHYHVSAPACSLGNKPEVKTEYDLLMAVAEPYTEAMSTDDDELTAGVGVEDEPTESQYDGVDVLAVNYLYKDGGDNEIVELNWVTNSNKTGRYQVYHHTEAYHSPACSLVFSDATNRAFGHDPEAVAEVRVVGGYKYLESGWIPRTGTITATMLTCDICNGQRCDLPESAIAFSHPLEYCATISEWVEGVEGVHRGDHYPGQAVYPDWDESYTYQSYLNSYCDLACELPTPYIHPELGLVNAGGLSAAVKNVNRLFDKAASKGHDLILYIGCSHYFDHDLDDWDKVDGMTIFSTTEPTIEYRNLVTATVVTNNLSQPGAWLEIRPNSKPYCATCDQIIGTCQCEYNSTKTYTPCPCGSMPYDWCPCGLEATTDCKCDFRTTELLDDAYVVSPALLEYIKANT